MPRIYTSETLVGQTFARLTVISLSHIKNNHRFWNCKCSCGVEKVVRGDSLKSNRIRSCGCLSRETAALTSRATAHLRRKCKVVLPNQTFGMLTAIAYTGDARIGWGCKCQCGGSRVVRTSDLTGGLVTSCGCEWKLNVRNALHQRNFTHRLSHVSGYYNWKGMVDRCTNPKNLAFEKYSLIGICKGLKETPKTMFDVAGDRPTEKHEIDRTNNKLGYFCGACSECLERNRPVNIRWATRKEQLRNRSNNALYTIDGVTHCASEWAEKLGLTRNQFIYRYRERKVAHAPA